MHGLGFEPLAAVAVAKPDSAVRSALGALALSLSRAGERGSGCAAAAGRVVAAGLVRLPTQRGVGAGHRRIAIVAIVSLSPVLSLSHSRARGCESLDAASSDISADGGDGGRARARDKRRNTAPCSSSALRDRLRALGRPRGRGPCGSPARGATASLQRALSSSEIASPPDARGATPAQKCGNDGRRS